MDNPIIRNVVFLLIIHADSSVRTANAVVGFCRPNAGKCLVVADGCRRLNFVYFNRTHQVAQDIVGGLGMMAVVGDAMTAPSIWKLRNPKWPFLVSLIVPPSMTLTSKP